MADEAKAGRAPSTPVVERRARALDFALRAALGKPTQFVKAQDVVQDAEKYLAFLEGSGGDVSPD